MKIPASLGLSVLIACAFLSSPLSPAQDSPFAQLSAKAAAKATEKPKKPKEASKERAPAPPAKKTGKTEANKETPKKSPKEEPKGVMILVEWIEVEHEDFSDWTLENKLPVDATDLRKTVQKWVKEDDAEILRTVAIHARSGQRAKVESIEEYIYPTEYDPAETPNDPNLSDNTELPVLPPNGTAFETRNLGTTVEVDPVISDEGGLVDLNLSPEMVFHLRNEEWVTESNGEEQMVPMPTFYAAKATTQVTVKNGGYALVGTLQPPPDEEEDDDDDDEIVLLFVRADVS